MITYQSETLSVTPIEQPVGLACSWCDDVATVKITDLKSAGRTSRNWVDVACHDHAVKYWPEITTTPRCEICGGRGCQH